MRAVQNFVSNTRRAMAARAMNQRELADAAHITPVHLNRILKEKAVPSLEVCDRIADALGLAVCHLLSEPEKLANVG